MTSVRLDCSQSLLARTFRFDPDVHPFSLSSRMVVAIFHFSESGKVHSACSLFQPGLFPLVAQKITSAAALPSLSTPKECSDS